MKIAFSVDKNEGLNSQISTRFGRASGFVFYDESDKSVVYKDNTQNLNAVQGAGIQAAQNVVDGGADAIVTVHCGPKAFSVFNAASVSVFIVEQQEIQVALSKIASGDFQPSSNSDVEGHWM